MTDPIKYLNHLKSLLTAEELEQLLDDPESLNVEDDGLDGDGVVDPGREMRMGAGAPGADTFRETMQKADNGEDLKTIDVMRMEAIILPLKRPAVFVQKNDYRVKHAQWLHLNKNGSDARNAILGAIPAVGRINLPNHRAIPYAGTGFLVGENLMMTNRHVAEMFVDGVGQNHVALKRGAKPNIDFLAEHGSRRKFRLQVRGVKMVHPFWDMALLEVEGIPSDMRTLQLSQVDPRDLRGHEVAVLGYPAFDPRNDRETQKRLFNRIFNVKRMQPGLVSKRGRVLSFDNVVPAFGHDASTLGGNSGSAIIDLDSGHVVGLHFGGLEGKSNYAVPTADLALDRNVVASKVHFAGRRPRPRRTAWDRHWASTEAPSSAVSADDTSSVPAGGGVGVQVSSNGNSSEITLNVPVKLTVGFDLGGGDVAPVVDQQVADLATEKMVEPIHDDEYSNRTGYDPDFLGLPVPMPVATNESELSQAISGGTELKYHNFSIVMNAERRLAQITACMVDARKEAKEPDDDYDYTRRELNGFTSENDREKWFLDPRIPAQHQLPDVFYNRDRTAFDKGHMVRREAVAFGDSFEDVQLANGDTFHSTNCSPQVKGFNRSMLRGIWGKLENDVLRSAKSEKCVVFSGPVFDETDRDFSGRDNEGDTVVKIPARYWKMVITRDGDAVKTYAYLLEQDLGDVSFEFAKAGNWTDHKVDPAELEEILGNVVFPHLAPLGDKMSLAQWNALLSDPETSEEQINEVSQIVEGAGAFDFHVIPDPAFVHVPDTGVGTENAMVIGNELARSRRASKFNLRQLLGSDKPVLVSEMDSWGQFPLILREVVDHLNADYSVWSVGAAGDTAENMVFGEIERGETEYMLALDKQRDKVKGFVFSAAGNDIIGEDPATGRPVIEDLILQFNGDPTDVDGHINHDLLQDKLDFLQDAYEKVIGTIRADADFKTLPIFIHGYDYPFPYPWTHDNRKPKHADKDKWLGKPFTVRGIQDRNLRRGILKVFINRLYDLMKELSGDAQDSQVWLVDCRGAMPEVTDWIDEIHGTSAGFKKVTARFLEVLKTAGV